MQLPQEFVTSMRSLLGNEELAAFVDSLSMDAVVAVRPNVAKGARLPQGVRPVPWSSLGGYLAERPAFTFDPLLHAGAYYVQEPSSMFVEQAWRACGAGARRVLDLCAAPGGKSTLLASLMGGRGLLVSNEPVAQRAQVLVENMQKWGHPNGVVTRALPEDFGRMGAFFDVILVDAPCSGEGMFRKDNPALDMWSPQGVGQCARRQRDILSAVWPALRPGGYLVYSTCTYNVEENERNVAWMARELGASVLPVDAQPAWNIAGNLDGGPFPVYHFMPHRTGGEGFFLALLQKDGGTPAAPRRRRGQAVKWASLPPEWRDRLRGGSDYALLERQGSASAVRRDVQEAVDRLLDEVTVLSAGIPLYELKGRKAVPRHGLAMSTELMAQSFAQAELTRADALAYLRRLSLALPRSPRGTVLLTHRGMPLGFANNLGSHANNLYPQNWRIRSGYGPEADVSVIETTATHDTASRI